MDGFHSGSNGMFASCSSLPSFDANPARFEMWPDRTSAAAMASQLVDTAWDIANLEARIGGSWAEAQRDEPNRIQDIELEISDHRPARALGDTGWPYHQSPCRLFGSRRRKRGGMGELTMHRSCASLTRSAEFGFHSHEPHRHQSEMSSGRHPLDRRNQDKTKLHGNSKPMGRHRSFDEVDAISIRAPQSIVAERPGIHRAMSIDEVELPDQFSSSTKRRRGRRPTPQSEEEPVQMRVESPQHRDLLKLLNEKQKVSEEDLRSKENRKLLHCIVYQQQMGVRFEELSAHVNEDIENDPEEAFLRPPIPMFLETD